MCGHLSHVSGEVILLTLSVGGLVSSGGDVTGVAASGPVPRARTHVCGIVSRPVGLHGRRRPADARVLRQPAAALRADSATV